jgi:hypothetical protein
MHEFECCVRRGCWTVFSVSTEFRCMHLYAGLWSWESEGILGGVRVSKNVPTPTLI